VWELLLVYLSVCMLLTGKGKQQESNNFVEQQACSLAFSVCICRCVLFEVAAVHVTWKYCGRLTSACRVLCMFSAWCVFSLVADG
jgi:hypothetical protein